jgi:hypothetical protein
LNPGLIYDIRTLGLSENYHPRHFASLWQEPPPSWRDRLAAAIEKGLGNQPPRVFFRADDIGAGGRPFEALCRLFRAFEIPLAMAVVPAWITGIRQKQLLKLAPLEEPFWGWHQHGWCHVNWQRSGKRSEFGEQRPLEKQFSDISQGRQKLQDIFGEHLVDVFTPPWNRLSHATIKILEELDFKAVSMTGTFPRGYKNVEGLKNLRIQLDLHTRKSKDGALDFGALLEELSGLLAKREPIGIMIHHQRMTFFAFEFLKELLHLLQTRGNAHFSTFKELTTKENEE